MAHSMYTELLGAALESPSPPAREASVGGALAELLRFRGRMISGAVTTEDVRPRAGWAAAAIADQLAYDVSLIRFARLLGVECDVDRFERPELERQRLEELLESRGVDLYGLYGVEGTQGTAPGLPS